MTLKEHIKSEMKFTVLGSKVGPGRSYISESDLLTLPIRNIRARQKRLNDKVLRVKSWENKSPLGERYSHAVVKLWGIYQN